MSSNSIRYAHFALFTVAFIYGANYSIAKLVLDPGYIEPFGFVLLRIVSGVLLFWIFDYIFLRRSIVQKKPIWKEIDRADFIRFMACGLFGIAINQLCFFQGLKFTTPVNASLIMLTTPILVLITSNFLLHEAINAKKVAGIALGIVGAGILVIYGKNFAYNISSWSGDLFVFINAASYGLYLVIVKPLMNKYHPITVIKWAFTFGLFFALPFGIIDLMEVNWHTFTTNTWLAVVYVLLCTTFLAYLLNAFALKTVNPSVVSIYIYLQPLIATAIALLFLKDTLSSEKIVAGMLIFTGVFLVSKR